jgi:hypothetical protein
VEVFDDHPGHFFGVEIRPFESVKNSDIEALIICVYDEHFPMLGPKLPVDIKQSDRMYWLFDKEYYDWETDE